MQAACRPPGWVIDCGEGGYRYFLSDYVLLECNLTGLVITSMKPDFRVRLHTEGWLVPYKYVNM